MQVLAAIPSPTRSVWHLGPLPIRAYALCIIIGILVAVVAGEAPLARRAAAIPTTSGTSRGWAIVLGIIGGRLYHVVTDPELYFGVRANTRSNAFKIWDGGLGIWGAIALGTLGAWIGCRRRGIKLTVFADAAAPGVVFAQGIGRWGNWFNNELYGGPTSLPWGLQMHCLDIDVGHATGADGGQAARRQHGRLGYFQPTFLYEAIWDVAIGFGLLICSTGGCAWAAAT